ncbi:cysteine-rich KTR domain-containing protein [Bariatricus massiliensis]|uniref:Cysteine-rich KTR domain-containing protein n=1 Tax=Bariatricus massiliensis TaxID=1745713 RepID=A0ABS8DML6_9FIRM|nr:cysteine-rich KTR domain-containing protein [Bariatricus massiliensis]MCB7388989.1 cysteine-rich KTR domain-containing protein [Bariatricus massiliensis]MCB7413162.1 cysteine-rich KTR domain-containing protein [Bariatricus massiliensis]
MYWCFDEKGTVRCLICGNKTRTMIRKDTEVINFLL